jgi:DNA primase
MRIRREDVDHVREASRIEEVIGEHVTLRQAGIGSMKGLCPFHDEKTPSFNVRPTLGRWHCFGCVEGGDVIAFVQKVDHLTFAEAVERLAARLGFALRYEDDDGRGPARRDQVGQRQRLIEAHRVAVQFYSERLTGAADALSGRHFLSERGFDRDAAAHFSVGFAPRSGESVTRHLRGCAFTDDEIVAAGLAGRGPRGLYDRFRGRLVWPIRDVAGDVVGFGARRLFDDDRIEAKYLNTPETVLYKKSQVLYGLDLAKKEIARSRQVVVVEGYTDVMACHLSGVETAVATCGTAFGADHIRIVRRLLGDYGGGLPPKVIYTFDGDEAGRKAARAPRGGPALVAQTFIAPDNMDPCELRQAQGDEAVRQLVESPQPLVQFAVRSTLAALDLDTAEGRVQGLRRAASLIARVRDRELRDQYARLLSGWLGMEVEPVRRSVTRAAKTLATGGAELKTPGTAAAGVRGPARAVRMLETQWSVSSARPGVFTQVPTLVPADDVDALREGAFEVPAYRAVHHAIRAAGNGHRPRALAGRLGGGGDRGHSGRRPAPRQ